MLKLELEKIMLGIVIVLALYFGPGTILDHTISHPQPYGYLASDTFQHQIRAEWIKDAGNFKTEAPYISFGLQNIVGRYPPVLYHLGVVVSSASGFEVYDALYLLVSIFMIFGMIACYFLIKTYNKTIALISLPIGLLIFSMPLATGILWGHWPSLLGQVFLIAFAWSIARKDLEKFYIPIALLASGIALTHTSELIFAGIFLILFFLSKILAKNIGKRDFVFFSKVGLVVLVVCAYYLIIFMNTWAKSQPYQFDVFVVWEGNPGFYIAGFGLLLLFIISGIVFSLTKIKESHVALLFSLAMLIVGFMNYVGFNVRAFQIRFMWPVYLSIFFGLGLYVIAKMAFNEWKSPYSVIACFAMILLIVPLVHLPILKQTSIQQIPVVPQLNLQSSQGIMNPYHWEILQWLSKSTDPKSKVYFFYGDIYSQDALLRNAKRYHEQVEPEGLIKILNERKITRYYPSEAPGDSGGMIMQRSSLFSFEEPLELKKPDFYAGMRDICSFDYIVLDKVSGQQVLAQYNMLIAQELIQNDFIKPIFENQVAVILKNDKPGSECLVDKTF